MANTFYATDGLIGAVWNRVDTVAAFDLGQTFDANDNGQFIYAKASEVIAANDACGIDETGVAIKLTKASADAGHIIAVANAAFAANEYGWFQRRGNTLSVNVLSAANADVPLYTSATAGKLDDSSTSQTQIAGVRLTATVAATGAGTAIGASSLVAIS